MAQRYTITEKDGFGDTRVFRVLAQSEAERPWDGRDVWANLESKRWVCRCTACSSPTVAMLASCSHARAVQRQLNLAAAPALAPATQAVAAKPQLDLPYAELFEGLVRRSPGLPQELIVACAQCNQGEASTLYLFWSGRPVDPASLADEARRASACLPANAPEELREALERLAQWADRYVVLCTSAKALRDADRALVDAAKGVLGEFDLTVIRGLARRHG